MQTQLTRPLEIARSLALVGLGVSVAVILVFLSRVGLSAEWIGPATLLVASLVPGLAASSLVLLASQPPRTPWHVHRVVLALVSTAVACGALGGVTWAAGQAGDDAAATTSSVLLTLGLVLAAGAVGFLVAQLLPARQRTLYVVLAIGPAALVMLLGVLPATSGFVSQLGFSASNLAIGAIFISPIGALVAFVQANERVRRLRSREAD